jgi:hypothetical protein
MAKTTINTTWRWSGLVLLSLVLGILFYFVAVKVVHPTEYPNKDFFSYWLAGRMALLGQNPYSVDLWIEGHHTYNASWISDATFLYPLPLSLLFLPFGKLPLYQAFVLWVLVTQFMILLSIVLLFRLSRKIQINHFIYFILAVGVLSRSITTTLVHGQIGGFLLLVVTGILCLWEDGKWWQGGALLPILLLKPNLGFPIVGLVLIYLIRQRKVSSLVAAGVSGLALFLVGFVQNPNWLFEFLEVGNTKLSETFGFSPTIWGAFTYFCNYRLTCVVGYGSCICILLVIGYLYLLWKKPGRLSPGVVVGFAITIMLLTTPYAWPYDQLLLMAPVIIVIIGLVEDDSRILPTGIVFFVISVIAMILLDLSIKIRMEVLNGGIPLCVLGLLTWFVFKEEQASKVKSIG